VFPTLVRREKDKVPRVNSDALDTSREKTRSEVEKVKKRLLVLGRGKKKKRMGSRKPLFFTPRKKKKRGR